MCKESLEVGSFFLALQSTVWEITHSTRKALFVLGTNKNPVRPKFKPKNNPTSAKFSDCNQVHQCCRLLAEAAVDVDETGHGQDNKHPTGVGCVRVPGEKTLEICDQKVIKYCERERKKNPGTERKRLLCLTILSVICCKSLPL